MTKKNYKIPAPEGLTVVYQYYVYEQFRQCVKTYVKKNVRYGSALRIYKDNIKHKSFISWRVFDSHGFADFIPYEYRKYLKEEGFEQI